VILVKVGEEDGMNGGQIFQVDSRVRHSTSSNAWSQMNVVPGVEEVGI
jgi:hypothetical protein